MSDRPTPETEQVKAKLHTNWNDLLNHARQLERERDEARESLKHISEYGTDEINAAVELRQKLATALVERDEARDDAQKSKAYKRVLKETNLRQTERIRYLEGATNHASGTPLSVALRERDDARENLDEEMKFHHRTHAELVQTQCKLLDMEMKCDQLQDEIKRLKVILDLIKKDVS